MSRTKRADRNTVTIFEVAELAGVSPMTVSRIGLLYNNPGSS
ncbi:MAG: LacI family DNA-binding transcriptional regulator [Acidobacteriaceae bacterium]|nr:LacI family DNA-binding transcriptional regulator [Acidobacteriaceae bacterium]